MIRTLVTLAAIGVVVYAVSTTVLQASTPTEEEAPTSSGVTYTIDNELSGVDADVRAHFRFTTDGTAEGNLGCNTFRADFHRVGDTMTFGPMMQTRKMCQPSAMDAERTYSAFFDGTVKFTEGTDFDDESGGETSRNRDGRYVQLTDDQGRSLYAFAT